MIAKRFFNNLFQDNNLLNVLRSSAAAGITRISGAILWLILNILIGRTAGPAGLGAFGICFVIVVLVSAICRAGLDNAVVREIASLAETDNCLAIDRAWQATITPIFVLSSLIGIIVYFCAQPLAEDIFKSPELAQNLRPMALAIPFWSVIFLHSSYLRGLSRVTASQFLQGFSPQAMSLIAIVVLFPVRGSNAIGEGFLLAVALTALVSLSFRVLSQTPAGKPTGQPYDVGALYRSGLGLLPILLAGLASQHLPVILLGIFSTVEQTGLYHAANRVTNLLAFIMLMVALAAAPQFARLQANGQVDQLRRLVHQLTASVLAIAAAPWSVIIAFPEFVLSPYGSAFSGSASSMRILAIGQAFNLLCGPVSVLLVMVRQDRGAQSAALGGVLVMFVTALGLIPYYGASGAAVAATFGLTVTNLVALVAVRRKLGFWAGPIMSSRS